MSDMTPAQRENCKQLWSAMEIGVDRWHENIKVHTKSTFLGYADVIFGIKPAILPGLTFKVRGVEVKLVNGKALIGFPQDRGTNDQYYPRAFPKTRELREVLTMGIFRNAEIKASLEKATNLPVESEPEATMTSTDADNPFEGVAA